MDTYPTLEATPTIVGGQVTAWKLCRTDPPKSCGDGSAQNPYPAVPLPTGTGAGHFNISITGTNDIVFAPKGGPIWAHEKGSPNGPGTDGQLQSIGAGGGKVLTFVDINTRPSKAQPTPNPYVIHYQLNFVDKQGNTVKSLDPDIPNGGKTLTGPSLGATSLIITSAVVAAIVALVVSAIVAYLTARATARGVIAGQPEALNRKNKSGPGNIDTEA
jgi:hypothetical protein